MVYEVPCKDCEHVYIGEMARILYKRLTEPKEVVRNHDQNSGIAVHIWEQQHKIDWESAEVHHYKTH